MKASDLSEDIRLASRFNHDELRLDMADTAYSSWMVKLVFLLSINKEFYIFEGVMTLISPISLLQNLWLYF